MYKTYFCFILLLSAYKSNSQFIDTAAFKKHVLTTDFISEGVAVGDVNRDRKTDVIAGAYWFEAPNWTRHEIAPGKTFDGSKEYSNSFLNFSMDVNKDGWIDLILIDYPGKAAHWYENPKKKMGHWKKHMIGDSVSVGNESPALVDVDGDGRKDLLCADTKTKQIVWIKSPTSKRSPVWKRYPISQLNAPGTHMFSHGLGLGDVNKDGRPDAIIKEGWWEAPQDPTQPGWIFHPANLGEDCSQMHVLDVNADGQPDIVSSAAHRLGTWWYEQSVNNAGNKEWKKHVISETITQTHASVLADLDKDGQPDLVTGKRFFAHNNTNNDPGTFEPPLLVWYKFSAGKAPYWTQRIIDNNSGVGVNIVAEDITGDKMTDIIISNKKGVFVFENMMKH